MTQVGEDRTGEESHATWRSHKFSPGAFSSEYFWICLPTRGFHPSSAPESSLHHVGFILDHQISLLTLILWIRCLGLM